MTEIGLFSITELKSELDAALIQLSVRQGLPDHDPYLSRVREAGDKLFSASYSFFSPFQLPPC